VELPARVSVSVEVRGRGLIDLAERKLDQAIDDRALVGKVEVQRGPRDERAAGDRVDRDALVGLLLERLERRVEDRALGVVA
jgi:hypothetical protein